jgi:hypothetical protein
MNAEATAVRDTKPMGAATPGRWSAPPSDAAVRAVVSLGRIPLRLLQTQTGRRLAATAVLSLLLVGAVSTLYAHADGPATPPRPLNSAVPAAVARPAAGGKATSAAKTAGASRETSLASVALARPAKDPQSAAVAWYANRLRISPDRVQALQQQRVNGSTTKVLVMAQVSETNVPTAFVTVKRAGSGWKVP